MSRKVSAFSTSILRPQLVSRFEIVMPTIGINSLVVEAATYPVPKLAETSYHFRGRQYFVPTKVLFSGGIWTCTVPEDVTGSNYKKLISVLHNQVLNTKGVPVKSFDIGIYPLTGYGPHISANIPILGSQSASYEIKNPFLGVRLNNCWIREMSEPQLNATNPTEPLKWTFTVRYATISLDSGYGIDADYANKVFDEAKDTIGTVKEKIGKELGSKVANKLKV